MSLSKCLIVREQLVIVAFYFIYFVGKNCFCHRKITILLFEWRSALGMRRVALASAESNAAPSVAKPVAARPAGKRPKNQCVIVGLFSQNGTLHNEKHGQYCTKGNIVRV